MKNLTLILLIASLFASLDSFACVCANTTVVEDYQRASFAAMVKIIKITPDSTNALYKDVDIEMITLYKGNPLKTIKIMSDDRSSCRFAATENTTWLIFAKVYKGVLSFGACSGSHRMDDFYDPIQEPKAAKNYKRSRDLEVLTLDLLKKHGITNLNPSNLKFTTPGYNLFDGYKNNNMVGVFKVQIKKTRGVGKVKAIEKFNNPDLNKAYLRHLLTDISVSGTTFLKKPTVIYIVCYYYGSNEKPGYLRYWNL
ncbi:hypothetical protein ACXZ1K_07985 [Pedobacter sp. PWIIR3]